VSSADTTSKQGHRAPTRREYLAGSAVLGSALVAGCAGSSGTAASDENGTGNASGSDESYSVTMAPVGTVEFDSVPERWVASDGSWADMGAALGLSPPAGLVTPERYHTEAYERIPGLSVDPDRIEMLWPDGGLDKELFYSIDADVHVIDPNFVVHRSNWEHADITEIGTNVGPFFGNTNFTRTYPWHEDYRYYDLYEAFEKLARVFDRHDRYRAFTSLHESFLGRIENRLPPESERPSVAVLLVTDDRPEQFYPYPINGGTAYKQWRDLGATSALSASGVGDFFQSGSTVDYEVLLEADPDALLLWEGTGQFERLSREQFQERVLSFMRNHDIASQLTAVENGAVYRGGDFYQGPIINLAWTERGAWQLYPDTFEWGEQLFDRERVGAIVSGAI
jgi:iron complex transport system substrate-binding protein